MSKKKKKKDEWLLIPDFAGQDFAVLDVTYAFALVDAAARMPIEGLEEDGVEGTPASKMRRMLVAQLRQQAREMAIYGNGVTLAQVEAAAKRASDAEPDPLRKDAAADAAIVALTGNQLHTTTLPPLGTEWVREFNRLSGLELDAVALAALIDEATREGINGVQTVQELLEMGAFSAGRATNIVRTETARAVMAAKLAKMKGKKKVWHVSPGACSVCLALEGMVLPLGVEFPSNGYFGPVQHPPAHPNCRCSIEEYK